LIQEVKRQKKKESCILKYFFIKEEEKGFNAYEAKKVMRDRKLFRLHDGGMR
jgi:hypothetical protein